MYSDQLTIGGGPGGARPAGLQGSDTAAGADTVAEADTAAPPLQCCGDTTAPPCCLLHYSGLTVT